MRTSELVILIIVAFLSLTLAGCDTAGRKSLKPSVDWSRGISLDHGATGSAGLAVGGRGERVHLVYSITTEDGVRIHYTQLDESAIKVVDVDLELSTVQIRAPEIVLSENGGVHLAWLGRRAGGEDWKLMHVILGSDGSLANEVVPLSGEGTNVGNYAMARYRDGRVAYVWYDRDAGGIFGAQVQQNGEWISGPSVIAKTGRFPAIRTDSEGRLHLAWLDGEEVRYSLFENENLNPVEGMVIGRPRSGTGIVFEALEIGLSEDWVYAFWNINNFSGLEAGTSYIEFVAFQPQDLASSLTTPDRILIGSSREQPFSEYQGEFDITQMVLPRVDRFFSSFVQQPAPIEGELPELAVALAATIQSRQDSMLQIVMAIFESGKFKGYSPISKTMAISTDPAMAFDGAGNFHVTWREGSGSAEIFYATTSSDAMLNLDKVEANDVYNALLQGGMDSAASILLFPVFGLGWMLLGLLILIVWKQIQDYETLQDTSSKIVLIVAVFAYLSTKVISFPTILTYLPFSAWIEIPRGYNAPIQWSVPAIIFAVAVLSANWVRWKFKDSTLIYYTALTATDAILTLAIYGITFFTAG